VKVTLLGHASVLVELDGARCLMDPVFQDPFEEGTVVSCPRRAIHESELPPIDVLILSHGHLDHFDIPTLARLPRDCNVICPKDRAISYAMKELGFTRVHETAPMARMVFPTYELMTTHSHVTNVVEIGMIFKDRSGSFWNQVDTVLAPETIKSVNGLLGRVDLLFAMHASQNFGFFESRSTGFPFEMHAMNLQSALDVHPRAVVPGAAGFRFSGAVEWCNAFLFPMSRERFVADLAALAADPGLATFIANPGDVFEVDSGKVTHHPAASKLATMLEDDTARLRFDPTAPVPPLTDPNPDNHSREMLIEAVDTCVEGFFAFLRQAYSDGDALVAEHRKLRAGYAVGAVFPDGSERWYRAQLDDSAPRFEGPSPGVAPADTVHRIAASVLHAWAAREKSYYYFRAYSRKFTTLYASAKAGDKVTVEPRPLEDLLGYYLQRKAKGADMALKVRLDRELARYK
jgi:L-ascorbate metabolism protein UlaG (beta-lactamase superfamily)